MGGEEGGGEEGRRGVGEEGRQTAAGRKENVFWRLVLIWEGRFGLVLFA